MKVVVAIDSLKESLSSLEAGDAIRAGILRVDSSAEVLVCPLADGGEDTMEAFTIDMDDTLQKMHVAEPFGVSVTAVCGILQDGRTTVLEVAAAVSITLVKEKKRNPLNTTTYGAGEMTRDATSKGCRHFIMGVGGSAANDGGIGMLQAFSYGLLDNEDKQIPFDAKGLQILDHILGEKVMPKSADCIFRVVCDVVSTLCGNQGCSAVLGLQKDIDPGMIMQMDKWLAYYATLAHEKYKKADLRQTGTGAAGDFGFAFLTFIDAQPESGIKIVLEETRPEDYVKEVDLVITDEGRLGGQTVMGKASIGVAHIAKQYGKPIIALVGTVAQDATACNARGIDTFFPILRRISTLQEAMEPENTRQNMTDTIEQALRLFLFR